MKCGDAGHILLSKHVAEDLEEYDEWRPLLHELGECEVKHGVRVSVTNLYTEELGNPAVPEKLKTARVARRRKGNGLPSGCRSATTGGAPALQLFTRSIAPRRFYH
jgi:hypothetical protein